MKSCTNCGATITCGCQERVASNGVKVCSNCITAYENQLSTNNNANKNENSPS